MKKYKELISKKWPYILFLFVWLIIVLFDYKYGKTYLDSDMASEMVLASQLNKEGALLSTNWYYSTEIRIFGNAILFKPLLKLFPNNWRLVRTIAQAILLLLTGISYVYMTSILNKRKMSVLFATVLICPFGFWNMWHGSFSGFYLIWIILYNFCAGLIFRICCIKKGKKYSVVCWAILAIYSFLIGLQSVRGLMNILIPLFLGSIILIWIDVKKGNKLDLSCNSIKLFISSMAASIFSCIGYLINTNVLSKIYSFYDQNTQTWQKFSIDRINTVIEDFVQLWGYPYSFTNKLEVKLFSFNGILSIFGVLLTVIVVYMFIWIIKNFKKLDENNKIVALSTITSPFLMMFVLVFIYASSASNGSYFLPCLGFIIAGLQIFIDNYEYSFKKSKNVVVTCFMVCILMCSINTCSLFIQNPPRSNKNQTYIADLLVEKGYMKCVGTFWNAGNVITELSNGVVESWELDDLEWKGVGTCLQLKDHVYNLPSGKGALIMSVEECDKLSYNPFAYEDIEVLHVDDELIVLGFEDISTFFR